MWQAPFEVGVGNVQVKRDEREMLSLKAGSAKWKNNVASVVWWLAWGLCQIHNSQKAAGHMLDLKHISGRGQEIKFPERHVESDWKDVSKSLDEATSCSHIQCRDLIADVKLWRRRNVFVNNEERFLTFVSQMCSDSISRGTPVYLRIRKTISSNGTLSRGGRKHMQYQKRK